MNKIMEMETGKHNIFISLLITLFQLIVDVYRKFIKDAGFARAGSLAYTTLMAAIPFAALVLSLMNAFGALDVVQVQIMDFIFRLLIPTRQAEVIAILDQFLENSNTLGVVGLVFFTITSVLLLNTISDNLNAVWGSKVQTNFLSKFTTYVSVIIFGSLLLAASTTMSSQFSFKQIENIAVLNRILLRIAPYIFDFFVILLIIGITPSGRVRVKYLVIVSAVGSVFWELLKYGFFHLSSWAIRTSVIYGTLALIPIFLFWVFIIWMIILIAMETAWILQHKEKSWMGKPACDMSPSEKLTFGFELFLVVAEEFENGRKGPTTDQLASIFSVSISDIREMTDLLQANNLLLAAGDDGGSWVPARSLTGINTVDVVEAIFGPVNHPDIRKFYDSGISAIKHGSIADFLTSKTN